LTNERYLESIEPHAVSVIGAVHVGIAVCCKLPVYRQHERRECQTPATLELFTIL